jgi:heat shock protein HtpX
LQARMYLLIALMFGILYGVMVGLGTWMGWGGTLTYIIMAVGILGLQYLISPALVGLTMKVRWVSEKEEPELHRMIAELAEKVRMLLLSGVPRKTDAFVSPEEFSVF